MTIPSRVAAGGAIRSRKARSVTIIPARLRRAMHVHCAPFSFLIPICDSDCTLTGIRIFYNASKHANVLRLED